MTAAVRTAPHRTHHQRPQHSPQRRRPIGNVEPYRPHRDPDRQRLERPSSQPRPNYAVRRAVAATIAVLLIAAIAVAVSAMVDVVVDVGGRPAAAADIDTRAPWQRGSHVAQPGDTLWSIAQQYRGEVGQTRFVDALIDLNGGTHIEAGQTVLLP